jgi:uncharacterized membrane protein YsdA (DUF1294 family)
MLLVAAWLLLTNLAAFWLFAHDKRAAERGAWRVSEDSLLFVSAIGGSAGALAAQRMFRHKTRKQPFQTLFRVVMGLQAAGIVAAFAFWDRIAVMF